MVFVVCCYGLSYMVLIALVVVEVVGGLFLVGEISVCMYFMIGLMMSLFDIFECNGYV